MMLKNVKMPTVAGGGTNSSSLKSALRRGFTIMELVIVIAVIAVLAAVLIPTFANLTERANESADTQTVENLNTILRADETIDGEKPATMQEALEHALSGGYNVSALTPTSDGNSILWNQEDNRFVLADSETGEIIAKDDITTDTTATGYTYWAVVGDSDDLEVAEAKSFSRYYTSADVITDNAVSANAGVDVSALETAVDITYSKAASAQDVVINGNGGALTVNADTDTVSAYGVFSSVDGKAVADESLHIYAEVTGNISIADGRLVIETGSSAAGVLVTGASVTIVVNDAANLGTIAAATGVSVDFNDIVTNNTNTPTSEIISTTPVDTTIADNFAGGIGTEASPYLIATAEQFKNISSLYSAKTAEGVEYSGTVYIFKQIADIELPSFSYYIPFFTGTYDGGNYILSFAENVTRSSFFYFFGTVFDSVTLKNINIELTANQPASLVYSSDWRTDITELTYQNVTIDSNGATVLANTTNFGFFGCYPVYNFSSVRFIDCVNNANLINQGTSTGAFIGSGWQFYNDKIQKVEYINCVNNGNITGTQNVGVLYGNGAYVGTYEAGSDGVKIATDYSAEQIIIQNVKNNGVISTSSSNAVSVSLAPLSQYLNNTYQSLCGGSYIQNSYFTGKTVYVSQIGDKYSINLDGADGITFKIAFNINLLDNGDGTVSNTTKYFYDITIGADIGATNILTHKAYDLEKATMEFGTEIINSLSFDENGIAKYVADNTMYLIFKDKEIGRNPEEGTAGETGVVVYLYAYDSNGQNVGVLRIK